MAKKAQKVLTAADMGLTQNPQQRIPQIATADLDLNDLGKLKFEIVSDKSVCLNHAKAAEYIDLPVFEGEREVADAHVQFLYDEMRKGTFNTFLVILSTAIYKNVVYKINGQHTAWALYYMPPSFSIEVREIKYRVNSEEQLKLLYSTYDRLKARSDGHITRVLLAGTPVTEGLWISIVSKVAGGCKYWAVDSEATRRRMSPDQVASMIQREHSDLFRLVGKYAQEHRNDTLLGRQPVMAAMFATFNKSPAKAPEFWDPVLTGMNLTAKTDARFALRETLLRITTSKHISGGKERRLMNAEDTYRVCVSAWNKWRRGEPVKVALRAPDARPPVN